MPACEILDVYDGELIRQGAEGRLYKTDFLGKAAIIKERFKKQYRHPELDAKLTSKRLSAGQEVRGIVKAKKFGVPTPCLYDVDVRSGCIVMEYIDGETVKSYLAACHADSIHRDTKAEVDKVMKQMAEIVATIHANGYIHGDLTSSNFVRRESDGKLFVIDFGLSFASQMSEDRAVDLYVLERALTSTHSAMGDLFLIFFDCYKKSTSSWSSTFNKLAEVRRRGRKRTMVG